MAERRRSAALEAEVADGDDSLRLCAATRVARSPDDLIRFVAAPDGSVVPDLARKLPGRGVWVTADRATVAQAVKSKAFARSLKRQVSVAADLPDVVERLLMKRLQDALGLANKAGCVLFGFGQIDDALVKGDVVALFHGHDAASGGADKLDRKLFAISRAHGRPARFYSPLGIEQMSLAMGRSNVVHAGLIQGGAADRCISEAERLMRFRSGFGASGTAVLHPAPDAPSN